MFCTKCGNNLPDNAKFCDKCGNLQISHDMSRISSDKEKSNELDSEISNERKLRKYFIIGIVGVITLVIIIAVIFSYVRLGAGFVATQKSPDSMKGGTLIPSPIPTATRTPVIKTVLFSDDLSHWRSEWDKESDTSYGKFFYSGGSLHIRSTNPPNWSISHTLNKNFTDFILDVDTKTIDGTTDNYLGVQVRENGVQNHYSLCISADGYWDMLKWENGNRIDLAGLRVPSSSYINTGIGATNHIRVEANKNTISFFVNGHLLMTVTDNTFKESTISLEVSSMPSHSFSEVAFNNLTITTI